MNYGKFCAILNKHIFEGEKKELLKRIAERPERFIGLFRPTKPGAKILQHLLQSHEIRFGDAIEEVIEENLKEFGFELLDKSIDSKEGEPLTLDQHFRKGKMVYFIEQKVRDDHDSTKKRGQVANFESKLEVLYEKEKTNLAAIIYFIDPDLIKNKNYYDQEIKRLSSFYGIKIYLFYGKELFEFLGRSESWEQMLTWLKQWKDSLPELPEINLDSNPKESLEEIKALELRNWRKFLENERLWDEGIVKAIFRKGETLKLLLEFFKSQDSIPYKKLASLLNQRLQKYF
ncbi:hypothetical protein B9J78_06660 [bacterium Unc6]|nr:hypothetical protein [bacterium Unc6]